MEFLKRLVEQKLRYARELFWVSKQARQVCVCVFVCTDHKATGVT